MGPFLVGVEAGLGPLHVHRPRWTAQAALRLLEEAPVLPVHVLPPEGVGSWARALTMLGTRGGVEERGGWVLGGWVLVGGR